MRLLIQYPEDLTKLNGKQSISQSDIINFYNHLFSILNERGIAYTKSTKFRRVPPTDTFDICLSYHVGEKVLIPNVWSIKKGYIPNYLYFDRTGFSGWAEMADSYELFQRSQEVDLTSATEFFTTFAGEYIRKNESKIKQEKVAFNVNAPYVFVAGQRPRDVVAQLSDIHTLDLQRQVAEAYADTGYTVVIKPHPIEYQKGQLRPKYDAMGKKFKHVIITTASIHDIIPKCDAVYTVNSGVGFEALLHKKQVFTSGGCDYHWVTTPLKTNQDVINSIEQLKEPPNVDQIVKFVYYMLTQYFVNANSRNDIEERLNQVLKEYNS